MSKTWDDAGAGAGAGASLGGTIGSVYGPIGTAVGAGIGAIVGGLGGLLYGSLTTDDYAGEWYQGRKKSDIINQFSNAPGHGNVEDMWNNLIQQGKPKAIDPTVALGDANKLRGEHLQAAAGMGMGGMFGFGSNFGITSGLTQGGLNPLSPNSPGVPKLPTIQPMQGPPNLLNPGGK